MNRTLVALLAGTSIMFSAGCSTKNYVRKEVNPVIEKTNELDELTARNSRDIRDLDTRAQQGIQGVTRKAKQALDELAKDVPNTRQYIVEVTGGTDSVGGSDYNYLLSQRRAAAVIQYLAQQHNIPAHKIYVIGLGKDKPAAANTSTSGRAKNRRVDVRLMTSAVGESTAARNANQKQQQFCGAGEAAVSVLLPRGLRP